MTTASEMIAALIILLMIWLVSIQFPQFRPSRWCRLIGRALYSFAQGLGAFEEVMALGIASAVLAFRRVLIHTWTRSRFLEVTRD